MCLKHSVPCAQMFDYHFENKQMNLDILLKTISLLHSSFNIESIVSNPSIYIQNSYAIQVIMNLQAKRQIRNPIDCLSGLFENYPRCVVQYTQKKVGQSRICDTSNRPIQVPPREMGRGNYCH